MTVSPDLHFADSVWVLLPLAPGFIHQLLRIADISRSALDVVTATLPGFTVATE